MSDSKTRTWPASLCEDPTDPRVFNVRKMDGFCVFTPGVPRGIARQACEAINQHYDWGTEA